MPVCIAEGPTQSGTLEVPRRGAGGEYGDYLAGGCLETGMRGTGGGEVIDYCGVGDPAGDGVGGTGGAVE